MAYKDLNDIYTKKFKQSKCIVLGNGTSVKKFKSDDDVFTIGVNDICKFVTPNVLFLIDTKKRFEAKNIPNRIYDIENANPDYIIAKDESWNFKHDNVYNMNFGAHGNLKNINEKSIIDTGLDSPYMGIQLAYKMGFRRIGILGVDYTPNHFYADDGHHELVQYDKLKEINNLYKNLTHVLSENNCSLFNLNHNSMVTTIPFIPIENF
ncbi:MAG: hypothetical protein WC979_01755 [Candidatus Pacearchaeota archaeon]|jgi:hypothetical protein|nr:hypothetical protein [Clostridia bacterium]